MKCKLCDHDRRNGYWILEQFVCDECYFEFVEVEKVEQAVKDSLSE